MKYVKALGLFALLPAVQAQAMLMDCAGSLNPIMASRIECAMGENRVQLINNAPADAVAATPPSEPIGFQFNPPRSANPLEESAPLIVFFSIMTAVFLMRTKRLNTK